MLYIIILIIIFPLAGLYLYANHVFKQIFIKHFNPPSHIKLEQYKIKPKEMYFQSKDGIRLHGWYEEVKDSKAIVILVHGYANDLGGGKEFMLHHTDYLTQAGYSVFLFDLRSFGKSEGNHTYLSMKEWMDIEAAYDLLKAMPENSDRKIGVFGYSMGAATSIVMAGKTRKPDFVIAMAPFGSIDSTFELFAKRINKPFWLFYPFYKFMMLTKFDRKILNDIPIEQVSKINVPLLIMYAKHDIVVDPKDSIKLYEKATTKQKELIEIDSTHSVYDDKPRQVEENVLSFLKKVT